MSNPDSSSLYNSGKDHPMNDLSINQAKFSSRLRLKNGVEMPVIGVGTYQVVDQVAYDVTLSALKIGYRLIDTARVYRNESVIGKAIKDSGIPRVEIFITSKLSPAEHGYDKAQNAVLSSLRNLGTDYIDLYLIHWPCVQGISSKSDLNVSIRLETWNALEHFYTLGKIRAIGVSNYTIKHLDSLLESCKIIPHVNQVELHPQLQQRELVEFCRLHNILVQPYSPLGTGKLLKNETVLNISARKSKPAASICLRWAIQNGFSAIPKCSNELKLIENTKIFDWELSKEDMEDLNNMDCGLHFCWDPTNVT